MDIQDDASRPSPASRTFIEGLSRFHIPVTNGLPAKQHISEHEACVRVLDQLGTSSAALFDFSLMDFRFRSEPSSCFLDAVHPQDRSVVQSTLVEALDYLLEQPVKDRPHYKLCYDFRMSAGTSTSADSRTSAGNDTAGPVRIVQQAVPLEFDQNGSPALVLIVSDVSPFQDADGRVHRMLEYTQTGESVFFNPEDAHMKPPLTSSDIDVLALLAQGSISSDAANILRVCICTVNKLRQKKLVNSGNSRLLEVERYAERYCLS
jgi:hypothetical protein